jgi:DNA-binding MarR family transcriptional regulator
MMALLARQTYPPDKLADLVGRDKQLEAYNLCDGSRTQGAIAKQLGLDPGNFSKTVSRWIDVGVLVKVAEGAETRLVHLYPIPKISKKG